MEPQPNIAEPNITEPEGRASQGASRIVGQNAWRWLTVKEFAAVFRLSKSTLRRRMEDGSIPYIQLGGRGHRVLIPENAVDLYQNQPVEDCRNALDIESGETVVRADGAMASPMGQRDKIPGPAPKWKQQNYLTRHDINARN